MRSQNCSAAASQPSTISTARGSARYIRTTLRTFRAIRNSWPGRKTRGPVPAIRVLRPERLPAPVPCWRRRSRKGCFLRASIPASPISATWKAPCNPAKGRPPRSWPRRNNNVAVRRSARATNNSFAGFISSVRTLIRTQDFRLVLGHQWLAELSLPLARDGEADGEAARRPQRDHELSRLDLADLDATIRATIGREARLAWKTAMESANPDVLFDGEEVEAQAS